MSLGQVLCGLFLYLWAFGTGPVAATLLLYIGSSPSTTSALGTGVLRRVWPLEATHPLDLELECPSLMCAMS